MQYIKSTCCCKEFHTTIKVQPINYQSLSSEPYTRHQVLALSNNGDK